MRKRQKGGAVVEAAFMMPWLAFLFVGVLDFGFYSYAAIATQAAARAAASATSADIHSQNFTLACAAALGELHGLPNVTVASGCAASPGAITNALPVAVSVTTLTCGTSLCPNPPANTCPADYCVDLQNGQPNLPTSALATVTYRSVPAIPIPGILTGRITLTRIGEMRVQK